jgi:hypothetical protein
VIHDHCATKAQQIRNSNKIFEKLLKTQKKWTKKCISTNQMKLQNVTKNGDQESQQKSDDAHFCKIIVKFENVM